jgi:hypothetical protein
VTILSVVTPPTVATEIRETVIELLERRLEEARAGKVDTVVIICHYVDGDWSDCASSTEIFSDAIGRLEILKQDWVQRVLRQR